MLYAFRSVIAALVLSASAGTALSAQTPDRVDTARVRTVERQIRDLEDKWNDAHVHGDTATLFALFAEDLTVTVPGMARMTQPDLVRFWRSGRARVLRHETDSVRVRTWNDAAIAEGVLIRQRNFNGGVQEDRWRFTKIYFRRHGSWQVVAYHASPAALAR